MRQYLRLLSILIIGMYSTVGLFFSELVLSEPVLSEAITVPTSLESSTFRGIHRNSGILLAKSRKDSMFATFEPYKKINIYYPNERGDMIPFSAIEFEHRIASASFVPGANKIAAVMEVKRSSNHAGGDELVFVSMNARTSRESTRLPWASSTGYRVRGMSITPNGRWLVIIRFRYGRDSQANLLLCSLLVPNNETCSSNTWELPLEFPVPSNIIFSPTGDHFVLKGSARTQLYSFNDFTPEPTIQNLITLHETISDVSFSNDGRNLAVAGSYGLEHGRTANVHLYYRTPNNEWKYDTDFNAATHRKWKDAKAVEFSIDGSLIYVYAKHPYLNNYAVHIYDRDTNETAAIYSTNKILQYGDNYWFGENFVINAFPYFVWNAYRIISNNKSNFIGTPEEKNSLLARLRAVLPLTPTSSIKQTAESDLARLESEFSDRGEFESREEFASRKHSHENKILELQKVISSEIQFVAATLEKAENSGAREIKQILRDSLDVSEEIVSYENISMGRYVYDEEIFPIELNGRDAINRSGVVHVPASEAQSFKQGVENGNVTLRAKIGKFFDGEIYYFDAVFTSTNTKKTYPILGITQYIPDLFY